MQKLFGFLFFISLIFTGCSLKNAIKQDPIYEKTLKYTQRCQIISSFETKALIDIVYLNPLYPNKFQKPTFLIGIYNDFNNTINNIEFNLTINNKPIKVSSIPNYILYKNFPFYNSWMNYYLITTDTKSPFVIEYKSKHWGKCKIKIKNNKN